MTTFSGAVGNYRDNAARYTSPKFSNTTVSIGLLKDSSDTTTASAATESTTGYDLGLRYAAGPLSVGAAYRSADSKANGTAAVPEVTAAAKYAAANALLGLPVGSTVVFTGAGQFSATPAVAAGDKTDTTMNTMALAASYNFGSFIGFAQYFDQEDKNNTAGTKTDADAIAVGVRVPMGKSTLFASYTDGEVAKSGSTKTDVSGMQLGVKYDLSKRTSAYVAYGEKEEQATGANKSKAENLAVGVFHSF
jgi:predicted porin